MAERNLSVLLRDMSPELTKGSFVFLTIHEEMLDKLKGEVLFYFKEKEGLTLVLEKDVAIKNNFEIGEIWSMITLNVNSDLTAVGFLAKISNALAEDNISVNAVSAYYHDHLFVMEKDTEKALFILNKLSE